MAAEPRHDPPPSTEAKRRRLTLMESYDPGNGAFSDSKLSEIADMIGAISQPDKKDNTETTSPLGEPHNESLSEPRGTPRGDIVRALCGSPSHSPSHSPSETPSISPHHSPHGESLFLTLNQALLYECAKLLEGRFTTLAHIARAVGVSVDTLRSCQRKLRSTGALSWTAENISGQNGMRMAAQILPYTVRGNHGFLYEKLGKIDASQLALNSGPGVELHRVLHQVSHQVDSPSCSSSIKDLKEILLQGLIYEDAFGELSAQSLVPYLHQFETSEEIQDFLDIANACIAAGDSGKARPIKNPQGFLIAQLKAGYINPPEGFKSRRVRSQESRNEQLKAELAELQRLKAEEEQLRFDIFKARLTAADQERLEQESKAQMDRRSPVSAELQLEVARDVILREWFAAASEPAGE